MDHAKRAHPTKKGPGRYHSEREHGRNGPKPVKEPGGFGKGLRAAITRHQLAPIEARRSEAAKRIDAMRREAA